MSNRAELFRLLDNVDYTINAAVVGDNTGKLFVYAREYANDKKLKCVTCEHDEDSIDQHDVAFPTLAVIVHDNPSFKKDDIVEIGDRLEFQSPVVTIPHKQMRRERLASKL
jgi:hypothetical protein